MIDSNRVAEVDGIENLEEDGLGHEVVSDIVSSLGDVREQVAFWAVLQNNKGAVV